jgi:AmiS/UreI family transporter
MLAAGRTDLTRATGMLCTAEGIYTGWIPGYLLLVGAMPGGPVPTH